MTMMGAPGNGIATIPQKRMLLCFRYQKRGGRITTEVTEIGTQRTRKLGEGGVKPHLRDEGRACARMSDWVKDDGKSGAVCVN
jgi:hypothetical protein